MTRIAQVSGTAHATAPGVNFVMASTEDPAAGKAKFRFSFELQDASGIPAYCEHARLTIEHQNGKRYAVSDTVACGSGNQLADSVRTAQFLESRAFYFNCHLHQRQQNGEGSDYYLSPKVSCCFARHGSQCITAEATDIHARAACCYNMLTSHLWHIQ